MSKLHCIALSGALLLLAGAAFAQGPEVLPAPPAPPAVAQSADDSELVQAPPDHGPESTCDCKETRRGIKPGDVQKVFPVRSVYPWGLQTLLSAFPADVRVGSRIRAISVSAPPAVMAAIEETIKRLDAPAADSTSVELTVYVLHAQKDGESDLPTGFEDVATHVRDLFGYKALRLVDSLVARPAVGQLFSVGSLGTSDPRVMYNFNGRADIVSTGDRRTVRLDHFEFAAKVPVTVEPGSDRFELTRVRFVGDFDLREGQRVVIGKSGAGEEGKALIVALSAHAVE
jgi:hypothetical protein